MRSSTFGEGKNAYRIFVEIGQQNTPTGKPRERERERERDGTIIMKQTL